MCSDNLHQGTGEMTLELTAQREYRDGGKLGTVLHDGVVVAGGGRMKVVVVEAPAGLIDWKWWWWCWL